MTWKLTASVSSGSSPRTRDTLFLPGNGSQSPSQTGPMELGSTGQTKAEDISSNKEIPKHQSKQELTHHRNTKATPVSSTLGGPDRVWLRLDTLLFASLSPSSGLSVETYILSAKVSRGHWGCTGPGVCLLWVVVINAWAGVSCQGAQDGFIVQSRVVVLFELGTLSSMLIRLLTYALEGHALWLQYHGLRRLGRLLRRRDRGLCLCRGGIHHGGWCRANAGVHRRLWLHGLF